MLLLKPVTATTLLDDVYAHLVQGVDARPALDALFDGLHTQRMALSTAAWRAQVADCLAHPLQALLRQDPFTDRAYAKPRGYAGDAVLLDFVYGHAAAQKRLHDISPIGRAICAYTTNTPLARAMRQDR